MFRRVALSILILLSVIAILPFADSAAHGLRQSFSTQRRHHRRHSRRWWRRYRAQLRIKKAQAQAAHRSAPLMMTPAVVAPNGLAMPATVLPMQPALQPGEWTALPAAANGELRFRANGNPSDKAALSVVAVSRPAPDYLTSKERRQILGGVSFSDLRGGVIERMVKAGGWVSNDYEREVNGHRVFVVTAQTPGDGRTPDRMLNFYFTEVNGRIYSLTTEANSQSADRMAAEAERFIANLR